MGDPRNWSPEKVGRLRSANAHADMAEIARCELFDHGPWKVAQLTPCETFRHRHVFVGTVCAGCNRREAVSWSQLKHTALSHRTWPEVMRRFSCTACGSGALCTTFQHGTDQARGIKRGRLSRRPPTPDELRWGASL